MSKRKPKVLPGQLAFFSTTKPKRPTETHQPTTRGVPGRFAKFYGNIVPPPLDEYGREYVHEELRLRQSVNGDFVVLDLRRPLGDASVLVTEIFEEALQTYEHMVESYHGG